MSTFDSQVPGEDLARLLDLSLPEQPNWRPGELSEIFEAELQAPIEVEIAGVDRVVMDRWRKWCRAQEIVGCGRLVDLIEHPSPPLELLVVLKQYAKAHARHRSAGLPQVVGKALYYLAILVALVQHGSRISSLSDADLLAGIRWCRSIPWVDGRFEEHLRSAERILSEG